MKQSAAQSFRKSIKLFIALWMGVIILSVVALSFALFTAGEKLQLLTKQTKENSHGMEIVDELRATVITSSKNNLFWQLTNDDNYIQQLIADLNKAKQLIRELDILAVSREEEQTVEDIKDSYDEYRNIVSSHGPGSAEKIGQSEKKLLVSIEKYHEHCKSAINKTISETRHLDRLVEQWPAGLVLFVASIVFTGSIVLIKRIISPTISLSKAAHKFGAGDFSARVHVEHDDELGMLCRTFNNMAEDIAQKEIARFEFMGSVVHDIRNPLFVIGGAAQRIKKRDLDREEQNAWLERIINRVAFLDDLVLDLVDAVQAGTGRLLLEIKKIDLTELVRRVYREQAECMSSHFLECEGSDACRVSGDEKRLERVLVNLISNAVKYSPEKTKVMVHVASRDGVAIITVQDQGVGISPEDLKILFQPFGRIKKTRRSAQGIGLGLFTVKKIIEAHGASITVASEPNNGTMFTVRLPLVES
ncbi:MAG: HAMP domain-containing sensor histidine kinase [Pseudomonadota bacterium]